VRRIVWLVAGVLLVVPSLGSDAPKDTDGATEADELRGTWQIVAAEFKGIRLTAAGVLIYRDGKYGPVNSRGSWAGTYTTDASRKPAHLDQTDSQGEDKGRTRKYIYRVNGDTLQIANTPDGHVRPKSFDENGICVCTYKRVKQ
jgi:uncharacterized protein (TIGR03067 family)